MQTSRAMVISLERAPEQSQSYDLGVGNAFNIELLSQPAVGVLAMQDPF